MIAIRNLRYNIQLVIKCFKMNKLIDYKKEIEKIKSKNDLIDSSKVIELCAKVELYYLDVLLLLNKEIDKLQKQLIISLEKNVEQLQSSNFSLN
jgi:hypothetical protein